MLFEVKRGGSVQKTGYSGGSGYFVGPYGRPLCRALPTTRTRTQVLFEVKRGGSVHAISEVLSEDKTVLFLSGWFHSDSQPSDAQAPYNPP